MQDEPISRADRLAFTELFKEIAALGRQARERRAAEASALPATAGNQKPQIIFEGPKLLTE